VKEMDKIALVEHWISGNAEEWYKVRTERLPEDDIEFVEVLWEVGKNLEDEIKEENHSHRKSPQPKMSE